MLSRPLPDRSYERLPQILGTTINFRTLLNEPPPPPPKFQIPHPAANTFDDMNENTMETIAAPTLCGTL